VREIADELSVSPKTISTHRLRILNKMKMKSNIELARYPQRKGLCLEYVRSANARLSLSAKRTPGKKSKSYNELAITLTSSPWPGVYNSGRVTPSVMSVPIVNNKLPWFIGIDGIGDFIMGNAMVQFDLPTSGDEYYELLLY
jgi:hypothetical protein